MDNSSHDNFNKRFFDRWSSLYDFGRMTKWFQYSQRLAIDQLSLRENSRIIDIGCGTGYAVLFLGKILGKGKACGIDISNGMIQQAKKKIPPNLAQNVEFFQASADKIPYPDETFDGVICTNSFHHYPDPFKALSEFKRILRQGGELVILDSARDLSLYVWFWNLFNKIFEKGHVCYYSTSEMEGFLNSSKFSFVELRYCKNEFVKHGKLMSSIQVWFARK